MRCGARPTARMRSFRPSRPTSARSRTAGRRATTSQSCVSSESAPRKYETIRKHEKELRPTCFRVFVFSWLLERATQRDAVSVRAADIGARVGELPHEQDAESADRAHHQRLP